MSDPTAEIAALKETVKAQSREIRDLKTAHRDLTRQQAESISALAKEIEALTLGIQPVLMSAERLNKLLIEADRQDGMKSAAKLIVGTGFVAMIGAAIAGIYNFFAKGMTP
jgi:hypothetical protein